MAKDAEITRLQNERLQREVRACACACVRVRVCVCACAHARGRKCGPNASLVCASISMCACTHAGMQMRIKIADQKCVTNLGVWPRAHGYGKCGNPYRCAAIFDTATRSRGDAR